jgi:hypothetical protein
MQKKGAGPQDVDLMAILALRGSVAARNRTHVSGCIGPARYGV